MRFFFFEPCHPSARAPPMPLILAGFLYRVLATSRNSPCPPRPDSFKILLTERTLAVPLCQTRTPPPHTAGRRRFCCLSPVFSKTFYGLPTERLPLRRLAQRDGAIPMPPHRHPRGPSPLIRSCPDTLFISVESDPGVAFFKTPARSLQTEQLLGPFSPFWLKVFPPGATFVSGPHPSFPLSLFFFCSFDFG